MPWLPRMTAAKLQWSGCFSRDVRWGGIGKGTHSNRTPEGAIVALVEQIVAEPAERVGIVPEARAVAANKWESRRYAVGTQHFLKRRATTSGAW
jgi:hypothetical protein